MSKLKDTFATYVLIAMPLGGILFLLGTAFAISMGLPNGLGIFFLAMLVFRVAVEIGLYDFGATITLLAMLYLQKTFLWDTGSWLIIFPALAILLWTIAVVPILLSKLPRHSVPALV